MKATGVSDIPKFGLLVILGHPTGQLTSQGPWTVEETLSLLSEHFPAPEVEEG